MIQYLVLVLKGMGFGLSNIVPGMTGGAVLIMLGIYEQFVNAVANVFTEKGRRREYLFFLGAIGLGAALAMVGAARILTWLLAQYPVLMMFFFQGLLLGTVPSLFKMNDEMHLSIGRILAAAGGLIVVVALTALERQGLYSSAMADSQSLVGMAYVFAVGFVAGGANITPGISGSYIFLLGGTYGPIMEALSALGRLSVHWEILVPTAMGVGIGIVGCAKVIDVALRRAPAVTAYVILGLLIGSVYGLWPQQVPNEPIWAIVSAVLIGLAIPLLLSRRTEAPPAPTVPAEMDLLSETADLMPLDGNDSPGV